MSSSYATTSPSPSSFLSTPQTSYSTPSHSSHSWTRSRRRRRPNNTSKSNAFRFLNPWGNSSHQEEARVPQSQPQQRRLPLSAHTLLAYHPHLPEGPLEYDLSLDPSHILVIHSPPGIGYSALSHKQLNAPATNPPIHFMTVICDLLPWTMTITAANNQILTVRDVIDGLYRGLRSKAKKRDWERLSTADARKSVRRAWLSRCNRHSLEDREYEESQGLRRVDFLGGYVAFRGLTCMPDERHWVMHVGPPKRKVKFSANS